MAAQYLQNLVDAFTELSSWFLAFFIPSSSAKKEKKKKDSKHHNKKILRWTVAGDLQVYYCSNYPIH